MTVTFTASGTGTVTNLAIEETIPAGWTYNSRLSAGTFFVEPTAGDAGPLAFAYNSIPTFPATLQYRLNVPAGQTGTKQITGTAAYNGGTPDDLQVGPKPTDIPPQVAIAVQFNTDNSSVPEGSTATFGVKLSAQPAGSTVVAVSRTSGDTDISVQSGGSLTFTTANWNVDQTVTLAAAQDADTANGSATIQGSGTGLTSASLTATESDDDPVVISVIFDGSTLNVPEGNTATFKVKLGAQPPSSKTVTVSHTSGDTDISVQSGGSLTFTTANWNVDQTVTLAAAQDADTSNGTATIQGTGSGLTSTSLTATEVDDDPVVIPIIFDKSTLNVPEGNTATFKVKLGAQPPSSKTVTVSRTSGDTDISVQSGGSLTFTTANWNVNQTVTLAAAQDPDAANGSAAIQGSSSGLTSASLTATEVEVDLLQVVFDQSTLDVPEGGTNTFKVKLSSQPANNTQVTVSRTSGDTDISVQGGPNLVLTFTTANWNTNQTVTLAAAVDADSTEGTATIQGTATGAAAASLTASEVEDCGDVPENDVFVNRIDLGSDTDLSTTGTNECATGEGGNFFATVWWKWKAPASLCDGAVVKINTQGSDFDTWLGVFSGSTLANLVPVVENDNCSGLTSCVEFVPQPNVLYAIVVDGWLPGDEGNIQLNLQLECDVVPPDPPSTWSGGAKLGGAVSETQIPSAEGKTFDGLTAAGDSVAIRLSADDAIDVESIAVAVDGIALENGAFAWQATEANDGWVLVWLDALPHYGDKVTIAVTARTVDGAATTGYGEFKIPVPELITGKSDVQVRVAEDMSDVPDLLGTPVSDVVRLWPPAVYAEPVTVRIPVEAGVDPSQLTVRYYLESDSASGWVPSEHVIGWLSGESGTVVEEDGHTYYEITVNHSGVLQVTKVLARANQASVVPVELSGPDGTQPWGLYAATFFAIVVLIVRKGMDRRANS